MSLHPLSSIALVLLALPLLVFFIFLELRRKQKFLVARLIAATLVIVALVGLFLRPGLRRESREMGVLLLTRNYDPEKIDSVVKKRPDLKILRMQDAEKFPGAGEVESWYDVPGESLVCVAGEGIPGFARSLMRRPSYQFVPARTPGGIVKLSLPHATENREAQVTGTYNAAERTTLTLSSPGGREDSITVDAGKNKFSLSFTPRLPGLFSYEMKATSGKGTSHHIVPVTVRGERKLRVLVLQKFPTAEIRFLKSFLAEHKHELLIRYKVSRNSYSYEFANSTETRFTTIQSTLLNRFDLLLIDENSLYELSPMETADLKKAAHDGLGVLVSAPGASRKVFNDLPIFNTVPSLKDTAHVMLSKTYLFPVIPLTVSGTSVIAVTRNKAQLLSGYSDFGRGKIGFQLLQETYRLGLEGNADDYAKLWTPLLERVARRKNVEEIRLVNSFPIFPNEPLQIEVIGSGTGLRLDSVRIPLAEGAWVDETWTGTAWAGENGWHRLNTNGEELFYFVSKQNQWNSLRTANQLRENQLLGGDPVSSTLSKTMEKEIPPVVYYFLFLLASAFLWLAPKV